MNPPSPALARALLSDLICTPVAMRADRFFALVSELFAVSEGRTPREQQFRAQLAAQGAAPGQGELQPWEEPIYSVDQLGCARVVVAGPIVKGYDDFTCWYWGLCSTDRLQATIAELAARVDVRSVRFVFNSPGGMSIGMPETAALLVALGEAKLTVGFTSDLAASNGYRLLAACGVALATPSACLGCIGTYIALYDYSEYLKQLGIKLELFRAGELKGIGLVGKELTDAERAFLQASVVRCNDQFTGFVRERRGAVDDSTMQGQWFDGAQALELNLVDALALTEADCDDAMRERSA